MAPEASRKKYILDAKKAHELGSGSDKGICSPRETALENNHSDGWKRREEYHRRTILQAHRRMRHGR